MERIIHFTPGFRFGGVETLLLGLYRHIDRSRFQFDFVTDNVDEMDEFDEIRSMGGRVYQFGRYLSNPIQYQKNFAKVINEMNPKMTVFHSHEPLRSGPLLLACKHRGIERRILHSHTDSYQGSTRRYFAGPILYCTNKLATQFLACSNEAGRFMFSNHSFSVFHNAIELNRFAFDLTKRAETRKALNINTNALVVGHTGRFTFQKNHRWIITVFCEFVKKYPNSYLLLVGAGPLEDEMRCLAANCGFGEKVIFTGHRRDVSAYLSAMDLFILPSHFEGLGISLVESQANGLPSLVSSVVTDEVCLTGAIRTCSLAAPVSDWVNALYELKEGGRFNTKEQIEKLRIEGYDVVREWKTLVEVYGSV